MDLYQVNFTNLSYKMSPVNIHLYKAPSKEHKIRAYRSEISRKVLRRGSILKTGQCFENQKCSSY